MYDPQLYRSKEEVERWKERDPIAGFERRLVEAGLFDAAGRDALEREVAAELAEAVAFAEAGTLEPVADLERFVLSERS
jgi:TPP-dependent pyruvate/acetoin dehydrogenase alpha subunit